MFEGGECLHAEPAETAAKAATAAGDAVARAAGAFIAGPARADTRAIPANDADPTDEAGDGYGGCRPWSRKLAGRSSHAERGRDLLKRLHFLFSDVELCELVLDFSKPHLDRFVFGLGHRQPPYRKEGRPEYTRAGWVQSKSYV